MSDQGDRALTVSQRVDIASAQFTPILRELVVGGKKLTEEQIRGRLVFAAQQGLDPVSEVHTLVGNDGKTMAHTMAINGLRRKNQEAAGPGVDVSLQFIPMDKTALAALPGALIGYECHLRDGQSHAAWQRRLVDAGKTLREAMGQPVTFPDIIAACGPSPVSVGIGVIYQSELSDYKDRNFNPLERAKKRAEVMARHHRWPTNAPVFDGEQVILGDVVDGAFVVSDAEQPDGGSAPQPRSVAQNMSALGFDTKTEQNSPSAPADLPIAPAAPAPASPPVAPPARKPPAPPPTGGQRVKLAIIRSSGWFPWAATFVATDPGAPYRNAQGKTDGTHLAAAAAALGFDEITDANLGAVTAAIEAHAAKRVEAEQRGVEVDAGQSPEPDGPPDNDIPV